MSKLGLGISRREFLAFIAAHTAATHFPARSLGNAGRVLLTGIEFKASKKNRYAMMALNTETRSYDIIPLEHKCHIVERFLPNPNIVMAVGAKPESRTSIVDLESKRVLKVIKSTAGYYFYGHGHSLGDSFVLAESNRKDDAHISVWNSQTFELQKAVSVEGVGVHDVKLLADGRILYGMLKLGKGLESRVNIHSIQNSKPDHTIIYDTNAAKVEHLFNWKGLVIGGLNYGKKLLKPGDSLVAVAKLDDERFRPLPLPNSISKISKNRALSFSVDPTSEYLYCTTSELPKEALGHILVWDLNSSKFIDSIKLKGPSGLYYDNRSKYKTKHWLSAENKIMTISHENGKLSLSTEVEISGASVGAHLSI